MNKNINQNLIIIAAVLVLGAIITALIFANAYKYKYRAQQNIEVKGLGSQNFESDRIVWNATFKYKANNLQEASAKLKEDRQKVEEFLKQKGIKPEEYVFSAINSEEDYQSFYNEEKGGYLQSFDGYTVSQSVEVKSNDLNKVEKVSREITDLISQGVALHSMAPDYYYSKLEELKVALVADATENARNRAENLADKAGAKLGALKNASAGVFQITGQDDNEDYTYGGVFNTKSRKKTASVTVNLSFAIR